MTYVIVLVVLFLVVFVITAPLRRSDPDGSMAGREEDREPSSPEVLELEAARDAKYREIRDAELDHQTGKLSDEDYQAVDSNLRAEAIEILRRLDAVKSRP
jgi:flagellar biosynthesis/type III secretory pathway M-ring protein FliF/YscJ